MIYSATNNIERKKRKERKEKVFGGCPGLGI